MDPPLAQRFKVLCEITRAQHFAWREATLSLAPDLDPLELVRTMWRITGRQTAEAYLKRLDPSEPLPSQVAQCIAWSSVCMGEEVTIEAGEGDEAFVNHHACPWCPWHEKLGLLSEDQPGCDAWFESVVDTINETLGANLRIETLSSLPACDERCRRRLWVD